jgi:3-hydroxyisobutyrate dehydrogenase-like beta-hydroxyacid dehydrogenase
LGGIDGNTIERLRLVSTAAARTTRRRHQELKTEGFTFVDAGISGGIRDLKRATA